MVSRTHSPSLPKALPHPHLFREVDFLFAAFLLFLLFGVSRIYSATPDTVRMFAKVRDFRISGTAKHPDFETYKGCSEKGLVKPVISLADDSSDFAGDERGPAYNAQRCITSAESFSDWYNDKADSINRAFLFEFPFTTVDGKHLVYENTSYFPLDPGQPYVSTAEPALEPFGKEGKSHNYGFTTEFHAVFTYFKDSAQVFTFKGDDDVWVFINDSLVIDLGGVHAQQEASVFLDSLPAGFLKDRGNYTLDFYHAERHTTSSQVKITTSIRLIAREKTRILKAKVRDINEKKHDDFQTFTNCYKPGYVEPKIDTTGDRSLFVGDNRTPKLTAMALNSSCMTTAENFDLWYNDRDTSIVRPFRCDIVLNEVEPGIWGINSSAYFPLDNNAYWIPFYPGGPSTFGYQSGGSHNYGFTTEIHSLVTYYKGTGQFFKFSGDDDVWAFINDSLVMDLGGVHRNLTRTLYLDSLPEGFLEDGEAYAFDFFHAERHTTQSNLAILTNFRLETYDQPGVQASVSFSNSSTYLDAVSPQSFTRSSDTLFIQIHDDSRTARIDTTFITVTGPNAEKETVRLIELKSSPGTYRGFIVYGSDAAVTPENGILETAPSAGISYTVKDIDVTDQLIPTPPTAARAPRLMKKESFKFSRVGMQTVFTAATDGHLSMYRPDGRLAMQLRVMAGQVCPVHAGSSGSFLFRWESSDGIRSGRILNIK